jgi:hypothetical protein
MKAIVLAVSLALISTLAHAQKPTTEKRWEKEPSDFRGVPFGSSMKDAKATLKDLLCVGKTTCISTFTLGEKVVVTNDWLFEDDAHVEQGTPRRHRESLREQDHRKQRVHGDERVARA